MDFQEKKVNEKSSLIREKITKKSDFYHSYPIYY